MEHCQAKKEILCDSSNKHNQIIQSKDRGQNIWNMQYLNKVKGLNQ